MLLKKIMILVLCTAAGMYIGFVLRPRAFGFSFWDVITYGLFADPMTLSNPDAQATIATSFAYTVIGGLIGALTGFIIIMGDFKLGLRQKSWISLEETGAKEKGEIKDLSGKVHNNVLDEILSDQLAAAGATTTPTSKRLTVFLCHASEDKVPVRNLLPTLRSWGHDPWLDEERLLPGQEWEWEIRSAMRQAHIVLVCLSRRSQRRGYVQKELRRALEIAEEQPAGAIFIIPVKLEPCDVPEWLTKWQWVDLFSDGGKGKLEAALQAAARSQAAKREGSM